MTAKRLVFLVQHSPPPDFVRKFFVEELAGDGYALEYWNVGPLMGHRDQPDMDVPNLNYIIVPDIETLARKLSIEAARGAIIVPQITRIPQSAAIYATLAGTDVKTAFYGRGYLPFVSEPKGGKYLLRRLLKSPADLIRAWMRWFVMRNSEAKKYDLTFTAGTVAEQFHAADSKKRVPIHHFDVDIAIAIGMSSRSEEAPVAVFLDDFLPFHPDFAMNGGRSVEPALYYRQLNAFFDTAERHLQLRFVIAAHPRAVYHKNPFGERELIVGRTAELVRDSALVVAHGSTAVSFAVIYGKPICLLHSAEIARYLEPKYNQILRTAALLGCEVVDISARSRLPAAVGAANGRCYADYYSQFLSARHDREHSSSTVLAALNHLGDWENSLQTRHRAGTGDVYGTD